MTEQTTDIRNENNLSPRRSPESPRKKGKAPAVLAAILAAAAGIALGGYGKEALHQWLGGHSHEQASAGQKQLWTCGMHPQVIQDKPGICPICGMALEPMNMDAAGGHGAHGSGSSISIDPVVVQNMGVRVATAQKGPVLRTVRAVGYLRQAQPGIHDVNLRVSGWVEKLHADTEGMFIRAGDPLFEIYSPEIQTAIEELLLARRSAETLAPDADEGTRQMADILLGAARRKLEQWGLTTEQIDELSTLPHAPRTITFLSPASGEVSEKNIVQGAMVKAGERAMQIVDRSRLWLDVQVYAQDFPFIRVGQQMTATVEGFPGEQFTGEVIFIHPQVDPVLRTAAVRLELPNPQLRLRPGMFASATLDAQITGDAVLVPREAIIDTGTRRVAFVSLGDGHFEPRNLKTGHAGDDGMVQVLAGIEPGELVVTSGQFLMDTESRMKEAIQKHLSSTLTAGHGHEDKHQQEHRHVEKVTGSQQWKQAVDATLSAYLAIAEKLGEVQTADHPMDVAELVKSADHLTKHASDDAARKLAQAVKDAADAMAGKTIDQQRELFKKLSDAVIALAEASPPSGKVSAALYVHHCPMAPGSWLQRNEESANPYYATEMKQCAFVKRTIAAE